MNYIEPTEPDPQSNEDELTIKMLKLKTGEQIIANIYDEDETSYQVQRPMELVTATKAQKPTSRIEQIYLRDWMQYCEIEDKVLVQKSDVVAEATPLPQIVMLFKREVELQDNPLYKVLSKDNIPRIVTDQKEPKDIADLFSDSAGFDNIDENGITLQFYIPKPIFKELLREGLIEDIKDIIEEALSGDKESADWDDDSSEDDSPESDWDDKEDTKDN
jgi:hypothetical protein